jgi:hypothetical protein
MVIHRFFINIKTIGMKVLKKEEMKLVKGGLLAGPREDLCKNLMNICYSRFGTIGDCLGGYVNCVLGPYMG